ncbi:MAG: hypothetical protein JNN20_02085 [Betaproteobacteria bacterium]|nr:hypothetical protein [Betaproteobacteria bacterium]
MDQALLKELAHFKLLLKKTANHSTDIEKLLSDKAYAKQVLSLAEESDNEELIVMALDLKDKLGLLPQPGKAVEAKPEEEASEEDKNKGKYVFGARG